MEWLIVVPGKTALWVVEKSNGTKWLYENARDDEYAHYDMHECKS